MEKLMLARERGLNFSLVDLATDVPDITPGTRFLSAM